ncbi:MAG: hypothetical protein ACLQJR_11280, partial [Stellaceae bacterium]
MRLTARGAIAASPEPAIAGAAAEASPPARNISPAGAFLHYRPTGVVMRIAMIGTGYVGLVSGA